MIEKAIAFLRDTFSRFPPKSRSKIYLIKEDGTHTELEADAILIKLGQGRELTITPHERFPGEGIGIACVWMKENKESYQVPQITFGGANVMYVNSIKK